ncbi:MAG: 3-deoxy-D-manno-octulosonic acid transferase, partial [Alphaproteobacteria bacterium]|nr:3-deoxy-D-manno-octulosonic acid transferase [Alphaproteobacteria bacterium]
ERTAWLAASTHPGEEEHVAQAHALLSATRPSLLLIIVPRHASRGPALATQLAAQGKVALRSRGDVITPDTRIYIADSMGELGLFYRLCDMVFMGGSLVPHGGQNPLEPARLSCAIAAGPHTHNFEAMYTEMEQQHLLRRVRDAASLAAAFSQLIGDNAQRSKIQADVKKWVESKAGTVERLMIYIGPLLTPRTKKA